MNLFEIRGAYHMTHLVFHRNKNQHRKATWWKWFSMLKRWTLKLLLASKSEGRGSFVGISGNMRAFLIPKCYSSFSAIVADGQFSTLGIVLLTILARLTKALGFEKSLSSAPNKKIGVDTDFLEDFGEPIFRDVATPWPCKKAKKQKTMSCVVVGKPKSLSKDMATEEYVPSVPANISRQRHKSNAVDDLFG